MDGNVLSDLLLTSRLLIVAVAMSYIAFIIGRFPAAVRNSGIVALWFAYWVAVLAQYVISIVSTMTGIRGTYGSLLGRSLADVAQSTCLLLIAVALSSSRSDHEAMPTGLSKLTVRTVLLLSAIVAGVQVMDPASVTGIIAASGLAFAALCWLAARWVARTAPNRRMYVAGFLFVYAADYLYPFGIPGEGTLASTIHSAVYVACVYCAGLHVRVHAAAGVATGAPTGHAGS